MQSVRVLRRNSQSADSDDDLRMARLEAKVDKLLALLAPEEVPIKKAARLCGSFGPRAKSSSMHSLSPFVPGSDEEGKGADCGGSKTPRGGGGHARTESWSAARARPGADEGRGGGRDGARNQLRRVSTMYAQGSKGLSTNEVAVDEWSSSEERSDGGRRQRRHRRRGHDTGRHRRGGGSRHNRGGAGGSFLSSDLVRPLEVSRRSRK